MFPRTFAIEPKRIYLTDHGSMLKLATSYNNVEEIVPPHGSPHVGKMSFTLCQLVSRASPRP